jgi:hypothetical protein
MPPLQPVGCSNAHWEAVMASWRTTGQLYPGYTLNAAETDAVVLALHEVVSSPSYASSPSDIDASHIDAPPLPDQQSHGGAEEGMEEEEATGEATEESEQRSPPATTPKKRPGL